MPAQVSPEALKLTFGLIAHMARYVAGACNEPVVPMAVEMSMSKKCCKKDKPCKGCPRKKN